MFNSHIRRSQHVDEAEKPFWISYADLMTALMILFLIVMLASLVMLTQSVRAAAVVNQKNKQQADELQQIKQNELRRQQLRATVISDLRKSAPKGVHIDDAGVIDFGSQATFAKGKSDLSERQRRLLRRFAPEVVKEADSVPGRQVINRVVIDGFTDPSGFYLNNVDLSEARSQRVLCSLLAPPLGKGLTNPVLSLFATSGSSSQAQKRSDAASRRIELRIEFRDQLVFRNGKPSVPTRPPAPKIDKGIGTCALDSK